jgi:hypothetical protein
LWFSGGDENRPARRSAQSTVLRTVG